MNKTTLFTLLSALVSTASFAAPTVQGGPVYPGPGNPGMPGRDLDRYDFVCHFDERGREPGPAEEVGKRHDCMAMATIYTRDRSSLLSVTGDDGKDDKGGYKPGKPGLVMENRMAVFCKDDGLFYADGARWEFDRSRDELVLMPPGAWYPQIRIEDPDSRSGDSEHREFEAKLFTGEGRPLHGHCDLTVDHGWRGPRP
jgi:hypothetical protein